MAECTSGLFDFIENSPCAYMTVKTLEKELENSGYCRLEEKDAWTLTLGGKYYVVRNDASLIAFLMPKSGFSGFHIVASHDDSPAFKIAQNPELTTEGYTKLSVEKYGGMILSTWLDRCLSVAGRVLLRGEQGIEKRFLDIKRDCFMIPNLAIHMNREMNKGIEYSIQKDMCPLWTMSDGDVDFREFILQQLGVDGNVEDILDMDLFLYNRDAGKVFGRQNEFIAAPRLDDLQCVYASMVAFLQATEERKEQEFCPVMAVFDNEEVGSATRQGADSTFLADVLIRIKEGLGLSEEIYRQKLANSFLLSADNAHGVHPNHPEKSNSKNKPVLNGGIVIKYQANQKYTTDGASAAYVKQLCLDHEIPYQTYMNHGDIAGGSTLGNIAITQLSIAAADIGNAQLAMHSAYESAGARDVEYMRSLIYHFYLDAQGLL